MSEWIPVSQVAREYNKHVVTIKRWCVSGFIIHLGFRVRRDPKGQWFLSRNEPEQTTHSKHSALTQ